MASASKNAPKKSAAAAPVSKTTSESKATTVKSAASKAPAASKKQEPIAVQKPVVPVKKARSQTKLSASALSTPAAPIAEVKPAQATTRSRRTTEIIPAMKTPVAIDSGERTRMIAEAAFFLAEKRGFAPGGHETDWVQAEQEISARFPLR